MQIKLSDVSIEAEVFDSSVTTSTLFILSHPHPVYGGTLKNKVIDQLFRRLSEKNQSVLRYNTRGVGQSSGTFDGGRGEFEDLRSIVEWSRSHIQFRKLVLIGYSFGSWITAKYSAVHPVDCVLIAPPVNLYPMPTLDSSCMKFIFSAKKDELVPFGEVEKYVHSLAEPKMHIPIEDADHYFIGTTKKLIVSILDALDQLE